MTQFTLKGFLSRIDLQKEKAKDYRNIVIIQVIIVVLGLTLSGTLIENSKSLESKIIISIFSFFGAVYTFLLWDLLRNFTTNRRLIIVVLCVLASIVTVGILVEFPFYQVLVVQDRQTYLLSIHGLLFPIEVLVISFALRDMFSASYMSEEKLWGAACIFLMVGISFGSLYDLITIIKPGSLGVNIESGLPNYSECVTYSFSILGGIDSGLQPSRLVRNISVIESVWGGIYAMLIIGKLLGLPREPESKE